jgi:hypothetical protein
MFMVSCLRLFCGLEWPEMPQRAGVGRASGHFAPIMAHALDAHGLYGLPRRALFGQAASLLACVSAPTGGI